MKIKIPSHEVNAPKEETYEVEEGPLQFPEPHIKAVNPHLTKEDNLAIDNTIISSLLTCKRKWFYRHFLGLVPRAASSAPHFGIWVHHALDIMYKSGWDLDTALEEWNKAELPPDLIRTKERGFEILKKYHSHYKGYPWEHLQGEATWEIVPNVDISGITLYGRIDRIVRWQGSIWIVDHKTTSRLGPQYFDSFDPNFQPVLYITAARELYENVSGMVIDAIFVGKSAPRKSRQFVRKPIIYSDERLGSLFTEAMAHVAEIKNITHSLIDRPDLWRYICPRCAHQTACGAWGGCEYRPLCRTECNRNILEAEYRVQPWTPYTS